MTTTCLWDTASSSAIKLAKSLQEKNSPGRLQTKESKKSSRPSARERLAGSRRFAKSDHVHLWLADTISSRTGAAAAAAAAAAASSAATAAATSTFPAPAPWVDEKIPNTPLRLQAQREGQQHRKGDTNAKGQETSVRLAKKDFLSPRLLTLPLCDGDYSAVGTVSGEIDSVATDLTTGTTRKTRQRGHKRRHTYFPLNSIRACRVLSFSPSTASHREAHQRWGGLEKHTTRFHNEYEARMMTIFTKPSFAFQPAVVLKTKRFYGGVKSVGFQRDVVPSGAARGDKLTHFRILSLYVQAP